ncbi:MAG TPA: hypothetical protein DCY00_02120 [Actinobacteria bacterium]|nr:hypothetical protein [Actinomycetota bacterium]
MLSNNKNAHSGYKNLIFGNKKERFWEKPLGGEMNLYYSIKYQTFFNIIFSILFFYYFSIYYK